MFHPWEIHSLLLPAFLGFPAHSQSLSSHTLPMGYINSMFNSVRFPFPNTFPKMSSPSPSQFYYICV